jgi:hypothetical protein
MHLNNYYKTAYICVRLWGGDPNAVDFRVSKQVLQIEQQKTTSDKCCVNHTMRMSVDHEQIKDFETKWFITFILEFSLKLL